MAYFNKVIEIGRITRNLELKTTTNGTSVVSFTIAVNRPYNKENDHPEADFLPVVAWRHTAEFLCKYFGKGDPVLIEGRLQSKKYKDKDNKDRTAIEIVAENVSFVEKKNKDSFDSESVSDISYSSGDSSYEDLSDDDELPF